MEQSDAPFGGLFTDPSRTLTRDFVGDFRWEFPAPDLNESARLLFRHLDAVMAAVESPGYVCLVSVELDVEAGRFPNVLEQFCSDVDYDQSRRYLVSQIDSAYPIGRLTFEARPGDVARVLRHNGGIRWGSALRLWGLHVPWEGIDEHIPVSPFEPTRVEALHQVARAAWLAADDLDALAMWVAPTTPKDGLSRLPRLAV